MCCLTKYPHRTHALTGTNIIFSDKRSAPAKAYSKAVKDECHPHPIHIHEINSSQEPSVPTMSYSKAVKAECNHLYLHPIHYHETNSSEEPSVLSIIMKTNSEEPSVPAKPSSEAKEDKRHPLLHLTHLLCYLATIQVHYTSGNNKRFMIGEKLDQVKTWHVRPMISCVNNDSSS